MTITCLPVNKNLSACRFDFVSRKLPSTVKACQQGYKSQNHQRNNKIIPVSSIYKNTARGTDYAGSNIIKQPIQ